MQDLFSVQFENKRGLSRSNQVAVENELFLGRGSVGY